MKGAEWKWNLAAGLLLAALVFGAFGGALGNGFVWFDDHGYVYENPAVTAGLTKAGLRWAFTTTHMYNWHPLTWLAHMADVELYGLEPAGHHLSSLLLHAANAMLLFFFLRRATDSGPAALAAAALWAVHPLRAESVVWISERKDVLAALFGLLALLAYVRPAGRGRMLGTAVAFAASLLAKPAWVTLPCLLLLLDAWPLGRWPRTPAWKLVLEKAPLWLLAAGSCAMTMAAQSAGGAVKSFAALPVGARLVNAAIAAVQYLRALVWPVDLAAFYPYPAGGASAAAVAGAAVLLLALTALAVVYARRAPWGLVGWLWFLGALVPMIGLVQVGGQAWADRYSYLPHIGLALALAGGWVGTPLRGVRSNGQTDASERRPYLAIWPILAGLLVAVLVWLAHAQTAIWRDTETLFRHALAVTRDNWLIHFNLANRYQLDGRRAEACAEYRAALAIVPNYAPAMNNLAWALAVDPQATPEEIAEALAWARKAIELSGGAPSAAQLNVLERAQLAGGDLAATMETARQAEALAERNGDREAAARIRWRLAGYAAQLAREKNSADGNGIFNVQ
jgi:tetratricopeptide (TPR) repeat protein